MARGINDAFDKSTCVKLDREPPGMAGVRCVYCRWTMTAPRRGNAFQFWSRLKTAAVAHSKGCIGKPASFGKAG